MASTAARLARAKAHIAQAREAAAAANGGNNSFQQPQGQQQQMVATAMAPSTQPVVDANDWASKRQQQMDRANALRNERSNGRAGK